MRILHVGKFYPIAGGVEKVMLDIVTGMADNEDVNCDMLCASVSSQSHVYAVGKYSKIICTSTWFKSFATMFSPKMITTLRRIKDGYDIIHIHHPDPMAAFALWMSRYRGKVILHWHSDILKQRLTLKLYMPLQRWLIRRADVVVGTSPVYLANSPFLQSASLRKVCIPIGIDPVVADKAEVGHLRQKYAGRKIVFALGRLVEYKGFEFLIAAAKLLPNDYVMLIGGSGPLKQQLKIQINEDHLQDKVKLLGRLSDGEVPVYFNSCDVYVLSSVWKTEAFGIVQVEAMSCGKPVVATKIPGSGVSWVNEDGVSGINIEPKNPQAIADAILHILSSRECYERFSEGARKRYSTLFRKDSMIENCINLYKSLTQK